MPALELKDVKALEGVLMALDGLEAEEQSRVLRWAAERLSLPPAANNAGGDKHHAGAAAGEKRHSTAAAVDLSSYETLAELLGESTAQTEPDRVLVAAAFLTRSKNQAELTSREINVALTDLGHGVKNITRSTTSLKDRKPQLMVQTSKGGSTQQAQKKFKVTSAGFARVKALLEGTAEAVDD